MSDRAPRSEPSAPDRSRGAGAPLRQRNFALLWFAGLISATGDWFLILGLPVYVYASTGSSLATSTVMVAELLPTTLLGSVAGVLVDRWDKRRVMIVVNTAQAALLLPLLWATDGRLWLVYVVAATQASLARVESPAKAALLPTLVGREHLTAANSLNAVSDNVGRLAGAPLGGLVVEAFHLPGVVLADATTFVMSAVLAATVRTEPRLPAVRTERGAMAEEWRAGLAVVRRSRPLTGTFAVAGLSQLAQGIFVVLFVAFVAQSLSGDGGEIGLLRGVQAVGGVLGGLAVGTLGRRLRSRALIGYGFVVFGLLSLATWNAPRLSVQPWLYIGLFVMAGVPAVATTTGIATSVQAHTPTGYLGRVTAAMEAGSGGLQACGLLVAGVLADRVGAVAVLDAQAAVYLCCGVIALLALAPDRTGAATGQTGPAARRLDTAASPPSQRDGAPV